MALKFSVATLDQIPEALRAEYALRDGAYHLLTEGEFPGLKDAVEVANRKVQEFRDTNIGLQRQVADQTAKLKTFEGVDPAEYASLKAQAADFAKRGAAKPDDVAALVKREVEAALAPVQAKLAETEKREQEKSAALTQEQLGAALRDAGAAVGIDEKAMPDFLARGLRTFVMEDGQPVSKGKDGAPVFSKAKAGTPLAPEEWAKSLVSEAPHLFKTSRGGGAASNGSGGAGVPRRMSIPYGQPMMLTDADAKAVADGSLVVERA